MISGPVSRNFARLTYGCTSVSTSRVARLLSGDMCGPLYGPFGVCSADQSYSNTGIKQGSNLAQSWAVPRLFCLEVGRLDDRPPFFDLGSLKIAERLRGLLVARRNILAEIVQALANRRIGDRRHGSGIELVDDLA